MIPAGVLRNMRATLTKSFNGVGAIYRPAYQGNLPAFLLLQKDVRCQVEDPKSQKAEDAGERSMPKHERIVSLPWGTEAKAGDLIKVGAQVYEIVGTDADRTDTLCLKTYCIFDALQRAQYLIGQD